jgi:stress-induced morphogen
MTSDGSTGHFRRAPGQSPPALGTAPQAVPRLTELLCAAFPGDEVSVEDRTGGGDHFQVSVASARFDGLSLVEQHKLVYDALAAPLADGTIHELRINTKGPTP